MNDSKQGKEEEEEDSDKDEHYVFRANLCGRLSRELNLVETNFEYMGHYEAPKEHGLSNSNIIIPKYYKLHENPQKILDLDFYQIIKDDIRNYRPLNEYQLEYLQKLTEEQKIELLKICNNVLKNVNDILLLH